MLLMTKTSCAPKVLLVLLVTLSGLAPSLKAIDPLPPELENAPLKEQAAWREKLGRESMMERRQVAEKRYDERVAFKKTMMVQIHQEAADRRMAVMSPVPAPLPVVESGIATPGQMRWVAIGSGVLVAGFVVRRWFTGSRATGA